MIEICPRCGNAHRDKTVNGAHVSCPACGHSWGFLKLPLFVITGASGVGKTTTVQALQAASQEFVCLDADFFYNIMPHETDADYLAQTEQMQAFALDVMQCGKPTVWAKAGNIDMLDKTYGAQFFSHIHVLALTCPEPDLRRRMAQGRGIADPDWLQSSADYNQYFIDHSAIGSVPYDRLDIGGLDILAAAQAVKAWLKSKTA